MEAVCHEAASLVPHDRGLVIQVDRDLWITWTVVWIADNQDRGSYHEHAVALMQWERSLRRELEQGCVEVVTNQFETEVQQLSVEDSRTVQDSWTRPIARNPSRAR